MADRTIKVLDPADSFSFLTLDEAKLMLGITDPAGDAQLEMWIEQNSATIMRMCNRIFAREKVQETWRDIGNRRVFLSHWPVQEADIESVTANGVLLASTSWELEEDSGKLSNFAGWAEPVVVIYTGGYVLPTDAPLPLKQATAILVRETKISSTLDVVAAGIKSISHKDKRVQFFDASSMMAKGGGGTSPGWQAVNNLLVHYTRWEV